MTAPARRKLPIGIQTFREIREGGYYYVDKTAYVRELLDGGKHYFLSRPRRFGKSLFLDTLSELFQGSEPLFRGLDIHDGWDWSARHPVLRLSFGGGNFQAPGSLHSALMAQLDAVERRSGVESDYRGGPERLAALVGGLHRKTGQPVAVLVDEYDKPILDSLDTPEVARANGDFLRGVYSVVKDADAHIRFSFFTGVSKFSTASLFSGLNNLIDITLEPGFSAVCGYTDRDLDTVFDPELPGLDRGAIRDWYNGYRWLGEEVYNPLMSCCCSAAGNSAPTGSRPAHPRSCWTRCSSAASVRWSWAAWWAAATCFPPLTWTTWRPRRFFFQTGYLTITGEIELAGNRFYRLGYPNREVRQSLNESLLRYLVKDGTRQMANSVRLYGLLEKNDFEELESLFQAFFASIPYEWYTNNDIADYEGYYASVFYSYFAALGLDITVEDSTSHGRLDMAVRFGGNVYLFEFKVVELEPEGTAMAQLREKEYAAKYRGGGGEVFLVGVEFSRKTRNVVGFEVGRG